eukprot:2451690-Rhodomonas_salina.1
MQAISNLLSSAPPGSECWNCGQQGHQNLFCQYPIQQPQHSRSRQGQGLGGVRGAGGAGRGRDPRALGRGRGMPGGVYPGCGGREGARICLAKFTPGTEGARVCWAEVYPGHGGRGLGARGAGSAFVGSQCQRPQIANKSFNPIIAQAQANAAFHTAQAQASADHTAAFVEQYEDCFESFEAQEGAYCVEQDVYDDPDQNYTIFDSPITDISNMPLLGNYEDESVTADIDYSFDAFNDAEITDKAISTGLLDNDVHPTVARARGQQESNTGARGTTS